MSLVIFRRRSILEPLPITTAPAPELGPATDIPGPSPAAAPPRPRVVPPTQRAADLTNPPAHHSLPSGPPSYTPGICHHDFHVTYKGERIGLLMLLDGHAMWLRCDHHARGER